VLAESRRQQASVLRHGEKDGNLGVVLEHGTFEGDDPGTWETRELGWAPEAEGKGDRSLGRMRSGSRRVR
jgi:hypothetical protein